MVKSHKPKYAVKETIDTLIWQTAASVAIPGFTIHQAVHFTGKFSKNSTNPLIKKWLPTAIGLALIPFIIHPIDNFVDYCMDNTIRPFANKMCLDKEDCN